MFTVTKPDGTTFDLKPSDSSGKISENIASFSNNGIYKLKEKTAQNGYQINTKEYILPIGMKFYVDDFKNGRDVSDKITLTMSDFKIVESRLRDKNIDKSVKTGYIYPNEAGYLDSKFNLKINDLNPDDFKKGDYFTIKISDRVNLNGVMPISEEPFVIELYDGFSLVAEGFYDKAKSEIKFYFTNYVDTFTLNDLFFTHPQYISLDKYSKSTTSKSENITYQLGNQKQIIGPSFGVEYREEDHHKITDGMNKQSTLPFQAPLDTGVPSLGSSLYQTNFNFVDSGGIYKHIIYVNPLTNGKYDTENANLKFINIDSKSLQNAAEAKLTIYKVPQGDREYMPYGFYESPKLSAIDPAQKDVVDLSSISGDSVTTDNFGFIVTRHKRDNVNTEDYFNIALGRVGKEDSYVIVVDGTIYNHNILGISENEAKYNAHVEYTFNPIPIKDNITGQILNWNEFDKNTALKKAKYTSGVDGFLKIVNIKLGDKIDYIATKQWVNETDNHPDVTFVLQQNGKDYQGEGGEKILTNGMTKAEWKDLPAKDETGKAYTYSVKEKNVNIENEKLIFTANDGRRYEVTIKDNVVTNKLLPEEKVNIAGMKTWNDNNNSDGIRPKEITVHLMKGEQKIDSKKVSPNEKGEWIYFWDNLPKLEDGKEIRYTIREEAVEGYKTEIKGYNIVNTHVPKEQPKPKPPTPESPKPSLPAQVKPIEPSSPWTSDETNILLYVGIAIFSLVGLIGALIKDKKNIDKQGEM
ncbi:MAG: Cna B-type domain-containing protein [Eubacteriales bacterium]|nr:Cna B-type domain-containing protein [Eubacteriales bacterium]